MNNEEIQGLIDRLETFDDSKELVDALSNINPSERMHVLYWADEAAVHIDGLYKLAKKMAKALEETKG